MKRAAEHLSRLAQELHIRAVYVDLDGTLLGPGGSLFAGADGSVSFRAAQAVGALHQHEVAVVPLSGRTEPQVREAARLLGATGFIAELGGITSDGSETVRRYGRFRGPGTPYEAMARSGAAGVLLEAYPGRLEPHSPWAHLERECTMLFRGEVDPDEARHLLTRAGYDLVLHDNGITRRSFPDLTTSETHLYHLAPPGIGKAEAVAADVQRRGLSATESAAVGDSPSDAAVAPHVGAMFIVANGAYAVERGSPAENVYVTDASHGDGFAEAMFGLLPGG
ncbi:MAG TPA: HAD family phosphatase [Actinomycetota bacterium]|nr:HAD family phosphatase [Actinomycetota bacterium]